MSTHQNSLRSDAHKKAVDAAILAVLAEVSVNITRRLDLRLRAGRMIQGVIPIIAGHGLQ